MNQNADATKQENQTLRVKTAQLEQSLAEMRQQQAQISVSLADIVSDVVLSNPPPISIMNMRHQLVFVTFC